MTPQTGRALAEELLEAVGLPRPWDIAEFCARVARHRAREIRLLPERDLPDSGDLIGRADYDEIHYSLETSEPHQWAIILHEVGHLLRGDGVGKVPKRYLERHWTPGGQIYQYAARHQYVAAAECAVEDFATTILERVAASQELQGDGGGAEEERLRAMFMS